MGIAEQMGRVLQRTSISVNIKERLDFSCALFGPDGSLVANAPHLPVHLGAMSEAIRYQVIGCCLSPPKSNRRRMLLCTLHRYNKLISFVAMLLALICCKP